MLWSLLLEDLGSWRQKSGYAAPQARQAPNPRAGLIVVTSWTLTSCEVFATPIFQGKHISPSSSPSRSNTTPSGSPSSSPWIPTSRNSRCWRTSLVPSPPSQSSSRTSTKLNEPTCELGRGRHLANGTRGSSSALPAYSSFS